MNGYIFASVCVCFVMRCSNAQDREYAFLKRKVTKVDNVPIANGRFYFVFLGLQQFKIVEQ